MTTEVLIKQPFEPGVATPASRAFAEELFATFPHLKPHAELYAAQETGPFELTLTIPSPTGAPERDVVVWVEDGEPSLAIGPSWHTHARVWATWPGEPVVDLLRAVLCDRFVLCFDVGGETDGAPGVVDLRDPMALARVLTDRGSPDRLRLVSWGGTADTEVGLGDLRL